MGLEFCVYPGSRKRSQKSDNSYQITTSNLGIERSGTGTGKCPTKSEYQAADNDPVVVTLRRIDDQLAIKRVEI